MNTKRITFWVIFFSVLALIVWGLIVADSKKSSGTGRLGSPGPVTAADHVKGPSDAPVTLIEYGDYQCPACGVYFPLTERVFNQSSSTLCVVFRNMPLAQHPNAMSAAMAAESAGVQNKYWEMHDLLYSNQSEWSDLSPASTTAIFKGYAAKIGLDMAKFGAGLADPKLKAKIQYDSDEAVKIGVNATPTFFVNGKAIQNPRSYEQFMDIIKNAAKAN